MPSGPATPYDQRGAVPAPKCAADGLRFQHARQSPHRRGWKAKHPMAAHSAHAQDDYRRGGQGRATGRRLERVPARGAACARIRLSAPSRIAMSRGCRDYVSRSAAVISSSRAPVRAAQWSSNRVRSHGGRRRDRDRVIGNVMRVKGYRRIGGLTATVSFTVPCERS